MIPPKLTLILVAATAIATTAVTWQIASWRHQADKTAALERAIEQANAQAEQDQAILTATAAKQAEIRTIYRTITKEVDRYAQARPDSPDCLDDTGMRLWTAAATGQAPTPAPDSTLSHDPAHP